MLRRSNVPAGADLVYSLNMETSRYKHWFDSTNERAVVAQFRRYRALGRIYETRTFIGNVGGPYPAWGRIKKISCRQAERTWLDPAGSLARSTAYKPAHLQDAAAVHLWDKTSDFQVFISSNERTGKSPEFLGAFATEAEARKVIADIDAAGSTYRVRSWNPQEGGPDRSGVRCYLANVQQRDIG